ncbi:hypothetical protein D3821_31025 [Escherichia coli]|nr:hypothetical protein D3821_31025 [Escherichia coli]
MFTRIKPVNAAPIGKGSVGPPIEFNFSASSRQPGGCGLSWSGITVIKKDNVIVFQVVIWPVQLNPVNANPHHKEANFPAML